MVLHQICLLIAWYLSFLVQSGLSGKHARCCESVQKRWDVPWAGATLQHVADLETDESLYFLTESEIHIEVVDIDGKGSGHADGEHLLVGRFIWMH